MATSIMEIAKPGLTDPTLEYEQVTGNDKATISQSAATSDGESSLPSTILIEHMMSTMGRLGYDEHQMKTVFDRATANIVEASHEADQSLLEESDAISHFVENVLLNQEKPGQKRVRLNSNELIVLLEVSSDLHLKAEQLRNLKENALQVLRAKGIRPVRVYMRSAEQSTSSSIGVAILNVVNTDIGGPSMVQLLDAAFHGEDWKRYLVLKEAYHENELLWRDVNWSGASLEQPVSSDLVTENNLEHAGSAVAAGDASQRIEDKEAQPAADGALSPTMQSYTDITAVPLDDEENEEPELIEHPAMRELREQERVRSGVSHPTWTRDDEHHRLLDIISTQSAGVNDEEPISIISHTSDDGSEGLEIIEKV